MPLADLTWEPSTMSIAVDDWAAAERDRLPTMDSFLRRRAPILRELPDDTTWWKVGPISWDELREMHAITTFHIGYGAGRVTKLPSLASIAWIGGAAGQLGLRKPTNWRGVVLFGVGRQGPFTVVEGNHRLLAAAMAGRKHATLPSVVHVALSEKPFLWHQPKSMA